MNAGWAQPDYQNWSRFSPLDMTRRRPWHYYRVGVSLCRKTRFSGELHAAPPTDDPWITVCETCRKTADRLGL